MKLSVNLLSKGKYYRSGEDIPHDMIPPHVLAFAVSETDSQPDAVTETDEALEDPHTTRTRKPAKRSRRWGAQ